MGNDSSANWAKRKQDFASNPNAVSSLEAQLFMNQSSKIEWVRSRQQLGSIQKAHICWQGS